MKKQPKLLVHFEDSVTKPDVFRLSLDRINAAKRRNPVAAKLFVAEHGEDYAKLDDWLPRTNALVCSGSMISDKRFPMRDLAKAAPNLRWIHVTGAGVENLLPMDWIHPKLTLTNNSGVHVAKTYEFGLMSLIMLAARAPEVMTNQRAGRWKQVFTTSPRGRTLLVVGHGELGGAVAKAGKTLGMKVVGVRRKDQPKLPRLLPKADVVYLAAPLTPETRGMIGEAQLNQMKPGAAIANIGRGALIDTPALIRALESGHLSGAVLDVYDPEPLPADSPLWKAPNVFLSPHASSDDHATYMPLTLDLVFDNARRLARGAKLRNVVDPKRGY
jgi:phosphoglycerate dehydrogenase-like enzyme